VLFRSINSVDDANLLVATNDIFWLCVCCIAAAHEFPNSLESAWSLFDEQIVQLKHISLMYDNITRGSLPKTGAYVNQIQVTIQTL